MPMLPAPVAIAVTLRRTELFTVPGCTTYVAIPLAFVAVASQRVFVRRES